MSQALLNGMLIQPTETGFVVTEVPPVGGNLIRTRMWSFESWTKTEAFVAGHFNGINAATKPLEWPVAAQQAVSGVLGQEAIVRGTLGQAAAAEALAFATSDAWENRHG